MIFGHIHSVMLNQCNDYSFFYLITDHFVNLLNNRTNQLIPSKGLFPFYLVFPNNMKFAAQILPLINFEFDFLFHFNLFLRERDINKTYIFINKQKVYNNNN